MEPVVKANEKILADIDKVELDERRKRWQTAYKTAPYKLFVDRQKYAADSWKATVGEDIEIRRAKLFKHVLENIDIKILDFDYIVGRTVPAVIGAYTCMECCGDYLTGLWDDDKNITLSMHDDASALTRDEIDILRDAARTFGVDDCGTMANKAWETVLGSWPQDIQDARIKDPPLNTGDLGNSTGTLDFKKILNKGLRYIINEAQGHIDDFVRKLEKDASRVYFWKAAQMTCQACIDFSHRYAAQARELAAGETDLVRKEELLDIARTCEVVPEFPARTFREALQCMAMVGCCKAIEHPSHNYPQWGRGDQYLYPFFKKDITDGALTVQKAGEMLAEMVGRWGTQIFLNTGMRETHQVTFGLNNICLGGITVDGKEGSNELSYLFLHTVALLHQTSPTVAIRWNHDTPGWLMRKAIKTNIAIGGAIPMFQNEENIIRLFVRDGVPLDEARNWNCLGCVWPIIPTWGEYKGGAAGFNGAAIVDLVLHNGVAFLGGKKLGLDTGDPRDFKTFDEFYAAFEAQLRFFMHRTLWLANIARDEQYKYIRLPFLTAVSMQFCMDQGQDTMIPDIKSQYGVTDRAIIDATDALFAVKKLVFDDKKLSMNDLILALDSNFEGTRGAEIQRMCSNVPKFGNDNDEVDELAGRIGNSSADAVTGYDNGPYPRFKSVREGLSWHYAAGLGVGALPNGRKAGEPLADGSASPMRGMDKNGPTAVLRSILKANFAENSYVQVLNQKFPKGMMNTDDAIEKLVAYTNAFMGAGGTHIQYNLLDSKELIEAKAKPEEYKDLIVRVGGFSAYFTQLSAQIQDDVIARNDHAL